MRERRIDPNIHMNGSQLSLWAPVIQTVIGAVIGAFGAIAGGAFGSLVYLAKRTAGSGRRFCR